MVKYFPGKFIYILAFSFSLLCFSVQTSSAQPDGKALYQASCAQCHSIGKGTVIGPDLKDIHKRLKEDWLVKWIKSSSSLIKSGDAYAVKIYNEYNKIEMPDQALSNEDISAVLAYIQKKSEEVPAAATASGSASGVDSSASDNSLLYGLIAAVIVLFFLVIIFGKISKDLENVVRKKKGLPEIISLPFGKTVSVWAAGNKTLIGLGIIALIVFGSVKGWYALASIGVSKGYHPEQPIKYSHKLHAGDMQIDCRYCHSGAEKGKTAGLPTAMICMNCHSAVKEGSTTGTEEIAKIYAALDYDPATRKYGNNPKPIQWVRVHNLPDLAYFNHSQHVKVGGVECQTCHGQVQEMGLASQFAPLTMAWCIDCHRTTPVKTEGNGYYENYQAVHFGKHSKDSTLTVEKIGGTECARCHY